MECSLKFKIPKEQIISLQDLQSQLLIKSNQLNKNKILESNKIMKTLKYKIEQSQKEITLIMKNIRDQVDKIIEDQSKEDERFLKLVNENLNPFECSQADLEFLVKFLKEDTFDEWIQRKQLVTSKIQKIIVFVERIVQSGYNSSFLLDQVDNNLQRADNKKKETILRLKGLKGQNNKLVNTTFYLIDKQNGDKVYKKDSQILRIEKFRLGQLNEQILFNLEQMKYLEYKGQYGIKGYKIKQWNYFWKGQQVGGGHYNIFGQKEGKWVDLCENYWDQNNVMKKAIIGMIEELVFGKFSGIINGGGSYDIEGEGRKKGKWIEITKFQIDSQVSKEGEYQNGKQEDGIFLNLKEDYFIGCKQYGFSIYDLQGNLSQEKYKYELITLMFFSKNHIIFKGNYTNAKKYGKWDVWFKANNRNCEKQIIGGGSYDEEGNWVKNGRWIDLDDGFELKKQITYNGEYRNGKKIGIWNILYKGGKIGGGSYDERGEEIKIGEWIEIGQEFNDDFLITNKGEYKDGKKFCRWDILIGGKQYGGGQYQEDSNNSKIGKWIEVTEEFKDYFQITYEGEYKNGKKFGKWTNLIKGKKIGGGQYEEDIKNSKIGKWIDVTEEFKDYNQIIQKGEYKNGNKFGRWDVIFQGKCQQKILHQNFQWWWILQ
ncbi:unnamed protein product [Paramecium octaurelia]|uniref:Uncharacterized protein n=1 Tax=Paramecium octaurelia TaxID=43137 RepID=A0A8S1TIY0_PAROT|nr:unnamed protein product [Paramecium octaurelia]